MNRWQAWAGRLRQRHTRIDAWRAQGAMVLLRGAARGRARRAQRSALHRQRAHASRDLATLHAEPATRDGGADDVAAGAVGYHGAQRASVRIRGRPGIAHADAGSLLAVAGHRCRSRPSCRARRRVNAPCCRRRRPRPSIGRCATARSRRWRSRTRARSRRDCAATWRVMNCLLPRRRRCWPAPQRAAARAAATEAQAAVQAAAARREADAPRLAQPAPAIDVDALTGMVIQQIDRRLVAYRERMGRG